MSKEVLDLIKSTAKKNDWLSDQYDLIQKKEALSSLEKQLEQLVGYNLKMEQIRNRVIQESRKFKERPKKTDEENLFDEIFKENQPADEFLIGDYKDEPEESVEDSENLEKPQNVQVINIRLRFKF